MTIFDIPYYKDNDFDCNDDLGSNPILDRETVIAFKIYDSCRHKECLDESKIGLAKAAESVCIGNKHIMKGNVIEPPQESAAVHIDKFRIKKIIITEKKTNDLKKGFWDITIIYVFEYLLTFSNKDSLVIGSVKANSIFNKKVTLFGSIDTDHVIDTDFPDRGKGHTFDADPFILAEAKAALLETKLHFQKHSNHNGEESAPKPKGVIVVIGLFTIIVLFRIVTLSVESGGLCISEECEDT